MKRWLLARVPLLLVGVVPALLLSIGVARFILNHFFAHAPYLLDSGLLSGVVYRSGPELAPPSIACNYATSFYQVYFSPIISLFSGLSYLVPVRRIEWFTFVQALVYLPIGLVVYSVSSQIGRASQVRRLPITLLAALAFSFSGIVLWMIGYPHYEAATPALICLVLAAVVTGRTRITWIVITLAVSVRQDGGLHVALAMLPLVYLRWRGVSGLPSQRRLLATIGVAIIASVMGFACQRLLWPPVDRLTPVYFGVPKYAHLTWALLSERIRVFGTDCQLIYYPLVGTALIAIMRRDARYLLGWLTTIPWFLFNFTAYDAAKATFNAYTAGPFLVAMFWVYLYGALLAPPERRLHPGVIEIVFILICLASTLGALRSRPLGIARTAKDMAFLQRMNRAQVHGFVDAVKEYRAVFGHLAADDGVAALAQEHLVLGESWPGQIHFIPDSLAFHTRGSGSGVGLLSSLILYGLNSCTHVLETGIHVCTRDPLPPEIFAGIETEKMPSVFVHSRFRRPGVVVGAHGISVWNGYSVEGTLGVLPAGTYEWKMTVSTRAALRLRITRSDDVLSEGPALRHVFASDGENPLTYRLTALAPGLEITGVEIHQVFTAP